MILKKLYLYHFRNYTQKEFSFSSGINSIVGKNAQGKTNLLEAIYLLTMGRSFRTTKLHPLIQEGAPFFYLEAEFETAGVVEQIKLSFDGEKKQLYLGGEQKSHFTPLIGLLPHVLYCSEDLSMVAGSPLHKRRLFNLHLSQMDPLYLHHLCRYQKAMDQRNAWLKKPTSESAAVDPWENIMAESGAYLMKTRSYFAKMLNPYLQDAMQSLSGGKDLLEMRYISPFAHPDAASLKARFETLRKKEQLFGSTLTGPHRDDLDFYIQGLKVRDFASEGQKHSALAALTLAKWQHLKEHSRVTPLMSIDDFGAHLDEERQTHFASACDSMGQLFFTAPTSSSFAHTAHHLIEIP